MPQNKSALQLALERVKNYAPMFWDGVSYDEGTLYLVDLATYRALEKLPAHLRSLDALKKNGFAVVATAVE